MKTKKRTPTGKTAIHNKKERPSHHKCANCKAELHGMKRLISSEVGKLSASEKRPSRPYGGHLCASCSREVFRERARGI